MKRGVELLGLLDEADEELSIATTLKETAIAEGAPPAEIARLDRKRAVANSMWQIRFHEFRDWVHRQD